MDSPVDILRKYWKHQSFRSLQEDIIQSVLKGKDTFALLPTGGGKSVCFQVPAMLLDGMCIVVSPLIALMKDQVEQLKNKGIAAAFIDASLHRREVAIILDNMYNDAYKFLYISPERIKTEVFYEKLRNTKVGLIAVDEAHCISQWGYDFRPAYLDIIRLREIKPGVPIIALTATATKEVKSDVIAKLRLESPAVFRKSFARENLSYSCFSEEDKMRKMLEVLQKVPGSSVVYVRNRLRTKAIAGFLKNNHIAADYYHAGLTYQERATKQENWIKSRTRVIVATNAFGMGIDKPDVRTVIHIDIPESLEAYYQEAGRSGRDEKKAYAVVLYQQIDLEELHSRAEEQFPDISDIKKVYQALANFLQAATGGGDSNYDFDLEEFQKTFELTNKETTKSKAKTVFYGLKHLEQQGFIYLNESFYSPSKLYVPDHTALYQFQVANAKFDPFIKLLLRIYGGQMYTDFVKISEKQLAKNLNIPEADIVKLLSALDKTGVVIYQPQKDKPQISFLQARHEASTLPFDQALYRHRKENIMKKMEAVVNYVADESRCRTQMLLEYFDEILDTDCSVCDNCLKKKRLNKDTDDEKNLYRQVILKKLSTGNMLPEHLMSLVSPKNKDIFYEALQLLIEGGVAKYTEEGKVCIQ